MKKLALLGLLAGFIAIITTACIFPKRSLKGALSNLTSVDAANNIVVKNSISFTRSADQLSGTLLFKTTIAVRCRLEISTATSHNNPQKQDCTEAAPSQSFSETLNHLPYNSNIFITAYLWPAQMPASVAVSFRVDENGDLSGVTSSSLIVSRVVLPQQGAEVHQFSLDTPQSAQGVTRMLMPQLGCRSEKLSIPIPFSGATTQLSISNLTTDGFAVGSSAANPNDQNRLMINFSLIQINQDWSWKFSLGGSDYVMVARPAGYLNGFQIVSGSNTYPIKMKDLNRLSSEAISDTLTSMSFTWDPVNLQTTDYLAIQLKGINTNYYMSCYYMAQDKTGTIDATSLSQMPNDTYEFQAILQSTQVQNPLPKQGPLWVISSQDWRYTKIPWGISTTTSP